MLVILQRARQAFGKARVRHLAELADGRLYIPPAEPGLGQCTGDTVC